MELTRLRLPTLATPRWTWRCAARRRATARLRTVGWMDQASALRGWRTHSLARGRACACLLAGGGGGGGRAAGERRRLRGGAARAARAARRARGQGAPLESPPTRPLPSPCRATRLVALHASRRSSLARPRAAATPVDQSASRLLAAIASAHPPTGQTRRHLIASSGSDVRRTAVRGAQGGARKRQLEAGTGATLHLPERRRGGDGGDNDGHAADDDDDGDGDGDGDGERVRMRGPTSQVGANASLPGHR
eukprot:scaffold2458_cov186-Prasinococcus_capsulatus_cf.AAC.2